MEKYEFIYDPTTNRTVRVKIQNIDNTPSAIRKMIVASRSAFSLVKHVLRIKPELSATETQELEDIVRERAVHGSSHSLDTRTTKFISTIRNDSNDNSNVGFSKRSAVSNAEFVKRSAERNKAYVNRKN